MSKQSEVRAHYEQRGLAASGDAYNRDMRKAAAADAHHTPAHHTPATDYFTTSCLGCCESDDPEEEWQDGKALSF